MTVAIILYVLGVIGSLVVATQVADNFADMFMGVICSFLWPVFIAMVILLLVIEELKFVFSKEK